MKRVPYWKERLSTLIEKRRTLPYEYGTTDCACFAFAAVEAVSGVVLFPGVERPKNWIGAAKFMISNGWNGIDDMMNSILDPVDPKETVAGDLVSFRSCGELHFAVRTNDAALTPADSGLVIVERDRWVHGWKIG